MEIFLCFEHNLHYLFCIEFMIMYRCPIQNFHLTRSRKPVTLHEWHVVRVSRTGRDGYLQIDNQASIEGMSKGAYTQLTLTLDLFVGGHRNFDEVAKNAMIKESFVGCIQKVSVQPVLAGSYLTRSPRQVDLMARIDKISNNFFCFHVIPKLTFSSDSAKQGPSKYYTHLARPILIPMYTYIPVLRAVATILNQA